MRLIDFDRYLIEHVTPVDFESVDLEHTSVALIVHFNRLRKYVGKIIFLSLWRATSENHATGLAGDFCLQSYLDPNVVVKRLIECDFTGIGVYWNGKKHSFHGDILPGPLRFWRATKGEDGKWKYGGLICDPKVWPVEGA